MQKALFALLGLSASAIAQNGCLPEAPASCTPDDCTRCYCLGPDTVIANAPVCPVTCDGDFSISVSGLYWRASEDGLEYALDNAVQNDVQATIAASSRSFSSYAAAVGEFANLIDAKYLAPNFKYDFGFKLAAAYCSPCDGWDLGVYWTGFSSKASSHVEAEPSDNHVLLPQWSAFAAAPGVQLFATDIQSEWKLDLNLIDIELGRAFWVSRYLSVRPHVGLRVALIEQNYDLEHKGGSWGSFPALKFFNEVIIPISNAQSPLNNEVQLGNDYKGVGVRSGLDSSWNFGCGFALYGNLAASIIYGRFNLSHDEQNRDAISPHSKSRILETNESFRASRAILDLDLGLQWRALLCDCKYGFQIALGWEQHLFLHQNQMWRVRKIGAGGDLNPTDPEIPPEAINNPENVYSQRRGTLSTQGVSLKLKLDF